MPFIPFTDMSEEQKEGKRREKCHLYPSPACQRSGKRAREGKNAIYTLCRHVRGAERGQENPKRLFIPIEACIGA